MPKITDKNFYEKVLSGEVEVEKLYDSANVLAFYHTESGRRRNHIVLLPKVFISDFFHVLEEHKEVIWEIFSVAKYLAKGMNPKKSGTRFYTEGGRFQKDPYLHFHLVADKNWE